MCRSLPLLIALTFALVGCKKDEGSPEAAAERFLAQVRSRDARAIWGSLTDGAQAELKDRHAALAAATGDDTSPEAIIGALGLVTLAEGENPVVVSPLGDRVTVRASSPRGSTDLHLVLEDGRWKVDLMRTLTSSVADQDP